MRCLPLLLALVLAVPAGAQIQTDRPGFGFSPVVVPARVLQVEAGVPQAFRETQTIASVDASLTVFSFPVLARYGITETIEARVGTSVYDVIRVSSEAADASESDGNAGFDVIQVGAKIQLATNGPVVAVVPTLSIPTTEANDTSGGARVVAGWSLTDALGLTTVLGGTVTDASPDFVVTGEAVAVVSGAISDALGAYVEAAAFPSDNATPLFAGGGLTALLSPNFQLDASVSFGLNDEAPDLLFGAGVSARF